MGLIGINYQQQQYNMFIKYLKNILISLDQLTNTLLFGAPDETISSRLGRNYNGSWMEKFVDWLFQWQNKPDGHCESSIEPIDRENGTIIK